jgi:hypothetical protein
MPRPPAGHNRKRRQCDALECHPKMATTTNKGGRVHPALPLCRGRLGNGTPRGERLNTAVTDNMGRRPRIRKGALSGPSSAPRAPLGRVAPVPRERFALAVSAHRPWPALQTDRRVRNRTRPPVRPQRRWRRERRRWIGLSSRMSSLPPPSPSIPRDPRPPEEPQANRSRTGQAGRLELSLELDFDPLPFTVRRNRP